MNICFNMHSIQPTLNINEQIVSLDTKELYRAIEIKFVGKIKTTPLLSDNYMITQGRGKIIILKTSNRHINETDLFKYRGNAYITSCMVFKSNRESFSAFINRGSLQLWNTLNQNWEDITDNWEDLDFDGKNSKKEYIYRKRTYDNETKQFTTTKEIRKK